MSKGKKPSSSSVKAKKGSQNAKGRGVSEVLTDFNKGLEELLKAGLSLDQLYGLLNKAANSDVGRAILEEVFKVISSGFLSFVTLKVEQANQNPSADEALDMQIEVLKVYRNCLELAEELVRQCGVIDYSARDLSPERRLSYTSALQQYASAVFREHSVDVKWAVSEAMLHATLSSDLNEKIDKRGARKI